MESFLEPQPVTTEEKESAIGPRKMRFGCISWTYPDWLGSFYPKGTRSRDFLPLYSRVFDLVEVDSTFYRLPSTSTVRQWRERTPPGFLFSVKLPRKITHEAKFSGVEKDIEYFEKGVSVLGSEKLACVICQLPPNLKFDSEFPKLESFLEKRRDSNPLLRYTFEFRNKSWFREETYSLLAKNRACFVWSIMDRVESDINLEPPKLTTDFLYVRFMGKFGEFKRFNEIQKDRSLLIQRCWKLLSEALERVDASSSFSTFVLVSNHFAGFAPATVNDLRRLAGETEVDWQNIFRRKE